MRGTTALWRPGGQRQEVAGRLLAIQAQDPRGARLAIRARSAGLSASDVDSALTGRSLIVTWLTAAPCTWPAPRITGGCIH